MDETKIEQVVATPEEAVEEVKAPEEAPAVEAPVEAEAPAVEEVVAEGCDCKEESCKAKKEEEDDQSEKEVPVKEGLQNEHEAKQRKEVAKEQSKDLVERMEDLAADKVTAIVTEAIANLPIVEGMSVEEDNARKEEIMENGSKLLADVYSVLEEVVNGTTLELDGAQVEVKDFVQTGGKVAMGLPAGINPPVKHENDEDEKKVKIQAYHEAEEIDYKAKYAESEANMDELVSMVEETADKYTQLVQQYNSVVEELQAYKISEAYSITVDDAADMLKDYSFDQVCEALDNYEQGLNIAEAEGEEAKAEDVEAEPAEADKEEEKKDKEEEKKEEKEEKAMEEIKESLEEIKEDTVIAEEVKPARRNRAFSVFSISESENKPARKAYSVFAD